MPEITPYQALSNNTINNISIADIANYDMDYRDAFNMSSLTAEDIKNALTGIYSWEFVAVFMTLYFTVSLFGVLGNGLVIYVVVASPRMKTPDNILIANLSLANFIMSAAIVPLIGLPELQLEWIYGEFLCKMRDYFFGINVYCSTLTIIAISVCRYILIRRISGPKQNQQIWNQQRLRATIIVLIIWTISSVLCLPFIIYSALQPVRVEYLFEDLVLFYYCRFDAPGIVKRIVFMAQIAFQYPIPLAFVVTFNYILHDFLRKRNLHRRRLQRPSETVTTSQHLTVIQPSSTTHPSVNNGEFSDRDLSRRRFATTRRGPDRNSPRTASLLLAMALSYALVWLPFTVVYILADFTSVSDYFESHSLEFAVLHNSCQVIAYSSLIVNPMLYGYLNSNFRTEFRATWNKIGGKLYSFSIAPSSSSYHFTADLSPTSCVSENGVHINPSTGDTSLSNRVVPNRLHRYKSIADSDLSPTMRSLSSNDASLIPGVIRNNMYPTAAMSMKRVKCVDKYLSLSGDTNYLPGDIML